MHLSPAIDLNTPVLTIDGSSGVGKGTTALRIAEQLGWQVLDSGAIYRVLAYAVYLKNLDLSDESAVLAVIKDLNVDFQPVADGQSIAILLNDKNVTTDIRTETAGTRASKIAVLPKVRQALLHWQRGFQHGAGLVADGRDMGTVVFPHAKIKGFLSANAEIRALRRYKQLKEKGMSANMRAILQELEQRDFRDRNRKVAPLLPAKDALIIDTSELSIDEVVALVLAQL